MCCGWLGITKRGRRAIEMLLNLSLIILSKLIVSDPIYLVDSADLIMAEAPKTGYLTINDLNGQITYDEESNMVIALDMPISIYSNDSAYEANVLESARPKFDYLIKGCAELSNGLYNSNSALRSVLPDDQLRYVLSLSNKRHDFELDYSQYSEKLTQQPKHGKIYFEYKEGEKFPHIIYRPFIQNYEGNDMAIFTLEYKGKTYKLQLKFIVSALGDTSDVVGNQSQCPAPKLIKLPLSSTMYPVTKFEMRDLEGASLGSNVGDGNNSIITLDTDAAGHGWYTGGMFNLCGLSLDANFSSPQPDTESRIEYGMTGLADMSNWLPTSNPNEWVARAGTAAAGKMDMLSVLLHEYGHALGIEHSADSHDYMATTLTPGMRRLPSADAMQLMAQLAGEAREAIMAGNGFTFTVANGNTDSPAPTPSLPINMGFGISFLGLLRRNSSTSNIFANAAPAQYDIAANTTLTNGNFAGNTTNSWETTGKVNASNGVAVLSEVSTSQTRLNQVFVVGADDRYLSFTLSNIGLEDVSAGPDDAFEVALLNANTGASLTAPIGLTRTDALLNIQANGAELKATGVTSVINPDGSRTYVVDSM